MNDGGVPISQHPGEQVIYACTPCGRRGVYSKAKLIAEHGDIGLPRLASILSAACDGRFDSPQMKLCKAYFPRLAESSIADSKNANGREP